MNTRDKLNFLSGKIQELNTAMMTYQSSNLLQLPAAIVEASYLDEVGCVWVAINKPTQHLSEFEKSFHVSLNYYKKGKPFYLKAFGTGRVVIEPEELNHLNPHLKDQINNGKILICVRILEANYHATHQKSEENILQKFKYMLSNIFNLENDYAFSFNKTTHYA